MTIAIDIHYSHVLDKRTRVPWCVQANDPANRWRRKHWRFEPFGAATCPYCSNIVDEHRRLVAASASAGQPFSPTVALEHWTLGDTTDTLRAKILTARSR